MNILIFCSRKKVGYKERMKDATKENFPPEFIIWDTEFTAWKGSFERNWSNPGEYRELVQIGAIRADRDTLTEKDYFSVFIQPVKNPLLSEYFTNLTHITQDKIKKEGISFKKAAEQFRQWVGDTPCYGGKDELVLDENFMLYGIPNSFTDVSFHNIHQIFIDAGINFNNYTSGTITEAFGKKPPHRGHNALNDARILLEGLKLLRAKTPLV